MAYLAEQLYEYKDLMVIQYIPHTSPWHPSVQRGTTDMQVSFAISDGCIPEKSLPASTNTAF